MQPRIIENSIRAHCPDCDGSISNFEIYEKSYINIQLEHKYNDKSYHNLIYVFCKCSGCNRGGLAKIHSTDSYFSHGILESFDPTYVKNISIPDAVLIEISKEFQEAEICMAYGANRATSALFRSTLEKILTANGYKDKKHTLHHKIEQAFKDGILTDSRRKNAQEDIRVLGNDVLHEEYRVIDNDEVEAAHHYTQRILEDFYDNRKTVEGILTEKGRIPPDEDDKNSN